MFYLFQKKHDDGERKKKKKEKKKKKVNYYFIDCSQSPYFSVGFSRPVCFDGAAAILVCKSARNLGRVSKLPRGGERSWEAAGKIGIYFFASHPPLY